MVSIVVSKTSDMGSSPLTPAIFYAYVNSRNYWMGSHSV